MSWIETLSRWGQTRAAEKRWRGHNARAKAAGCPCGRPAQIAERHHDVVGSVPGETWTCADHHGVASWMQIGDGPNIPYWPRRTRCDRCSTATSCGSVTRDGETEPYEYHCPNR